MLPNFIIAGAARSGTTSLYRYCAEHPQVLMSRVKETNYFSSNPFGFTHHTYQKLFENTADATALGEASPSYLYHPSAPYAIKQAIPECKIVIILRNPVDRLISDFFYSRSWGSNLDLDFTGFVSACLAGEGRGREGFVPELMARKGLYADQVRRYMATFAPENLFIRLYDDLRSEPAHLMSDLYSFLGVDSSFRPQIAHVHNGDSEPVFSWVSRLARRSRRFEVRFVNPLLPSSARGAGSLTNSIMMLNRRRRPVQRRRPMPHPEDRERLLEFYRQNIWDLQELLGRSLEPWLSTTLVAEATVNQ